jgi:flavin reductase (DIM6/NTAB) family NADH-FMN oxidoreductase RutF
MANPEETRPVRAAEPGVDFALFRLIAGHWLTGVAIVTSADRDGRPFGLTMSAVTSLSLDPPQFLICIDNRSDTLPAIRASGCFCIQYLRSDQEAVAAAFARKNSDKFSPFHFHPGHTGAPILDGVIAFAECRVHATYPGGDHTIVVGDVVYGEAVGGAPLAYFRGGYRSLESGG